MAGVLILPPLQTLREGVSPEFTGCDAPTPPNTMSISIVHCSKPDSHSQGFIHNLRNTCYQRGHGAKSTRNLVSTESED